MNKTEQTLFDLFKVIRLDKPLSKWTCQVNKTPSLNVNGIWTG